MRNKRSTEDTYVSREDMIKNIKKDVRRARIFYTIWGWALALTMIFFLVAGILSGMK